MTPQERVRRGFSLSMSARKVIAHQIRLENPALNDREVRLRVAEQIYMAEPAVLALIEQARERARGGEERRDSLETSLDKSPSGYTSC